MKIKVKVFLLVFISSLLIFTLVISYILSVFKTYSLNDAKKQVEQYNSHTADLVKTTLEKDLSVCATIVQSFKAYGKESPNLRDKLYRSVLKNVLEENPEYLSTWMSWELKFIDKNYLANYGRQRTATFRELGLIKFYIDSLDLTGDNPVSLYYQAKQSKLDVLSNPYYYKYAKELKDSVLETSIAAPIMIGNKFAGLAGIDITLDRFNKLIKASKPYSSSEIYLLSNTGTIISTSANDSVKNSSIIKLYPELAKLNTLQNIAKGRFFSNSFTDSINKTRFASFAPISVGSSTNSWSVCLILPHKFIKKRFQNTLLKSISIGLVGVLIISIMSYLIASRIAKRIKHVSNVINYLSRGMIDVPIISLSRYKDELADITSAITKLKERLKKTTKFARQIGRGDLSAKFDSIDSNDTLGNAMIDMQKSLQLEQAQGKISQKERERLNWTQKGLTELSELLRMSNEDFQEYLLSILRYILTYFKAEQGAIFLLNTSDKENPFLELRSAYAYDKKRSLEARLEIGENIVGRCFKEKETIYMTNIPEGYTFVSSGLGEHQPKCLFLMPLLFEKEALGVVEIAAFREFEDFEIEFLKVVGERIASSISVMEKNFETQKFVSQYRTKSEELEKIKITLRNNSNQLLIAQLNAKDYELETSAISDAISDFASVAWINLDMRVMDVKDKHLEKQGHSQIEIIRKKQSSLSTIKHNQSVEFNNMWKALLKGEEHQIEHFYMFNDEKVKMIDIFKPVRNNDGIVIKILNITLDYGRLN